MDVEVNHSSFSDGDSDLDEKSLYLNNGEQDEDISPSNISHVGIKSSSMVVIPTSSQPTNPENYNDKEASAESSDFGIVQHLIGSDDVKANSTAAVLLDSTDIFKPLDQISTKIKEALYFPEDPPPSNTNLQDEHDNSFTLPETIKAEVPVAITNFQTNVRPASFSRTHSKLARPVAGAKLYLKSSLVENKSSITNETPFDPSKSTIAVPAPANFVEPLNTAIHWSSSMVIRYLKQIIELPQYERDFLRYEVDGYTFITLDSEDLKAMNIKIAIHQSKIMAHSLHLRELVIRGGAKHRPKLFIRWGVEHIAGWLTHDLNCKVSGFICLFNRVDAESVTTLRRIGLENLLSADVISEEERNLVVDQLMVKCESIQPSRTLSVPSKGKKKRASTRMSKRNPEALKSVDGEEDTGDNFIASMSAKFRSLSQSRQRNHLEDFAVSQAITSHGDASAKDDSVPLYDETGLDNLAPPVMSDPKQCIPRPPAIASSTSNPISIIAKQPIASVDTQHSYPDLSSTSNPGLKQRAGISNSHRNRFRRRSSLFPGLPYTELEREQQRAADVAAAIQSRHDILLERASLAAATSVYMRQSLESLAQGTTNTGNESMRDLGDNVNMCLSDDVGLMMNMNNSSSTTNGDLVKGIQSLTQAVQAQLSAIAILQNNTQRLAEEKVKAEIEAKQLRQSIKAAEDQIRELHSEHVRATQAMTSLLTSAISTGDNTDEKINRAIHNDVNILSSLQSSAAGNGSVLDEENPHNHDNVIASRDPPPPYDSKAAITRGHISDNQIELSPETVESTPQSSTQSLRTSDATSDRTEVDSQSELNRLNKPHDNPVGPLTNTRSTALTRRVYGTGAGKVQFKNAVNGAENTGKKGEKISSHSGKFVIVINDENPLHKAQCLLAGTLKGSDLKVSKSHHLFNLDPVSMRNQVESNAARHMNNWKHIRKCCRLHNHTRLFGTDISLTFRKLSLLWVRLGLEVCNLGESKDEHGEPTEVGQAITSLLQCAEDQVKQSVTKLESKSSDGQRFTSTKTVVENSSVPVRLNRYHRATIAVWSLAFIRKLLNRCKDADPSYQLMMFEKLQSGTIPIADLSRDDLFHVFSRQLRITFASWNIFDEVLLRFGHKKHGLVGPLQVISAFHEICACSDNGFPSSIPQRAIRGKLATQAVTAPGSSTIVSQNFSDHNDLRQRRMLILLGLITTGLFSYQDSIASTFEGVVTGRVEDFSSFKHALHTVSGSNLQSMSEHSDSDENYSVAAEIPEGSRVIEERDAMASQLMQADISLVTDLLGQLAIRGVLAVFPQGEEEMQMTLSNVDVRKYCAYTKSDALKYVLQDLQACCAEVARSLQIYRQEPSIISTSLNPGSSDRFILSDLASFLISFSSFRRQSLKCLMESPHLISRSHRTGDALIPFQDTFDEGTRLDVELLMTGEANQAMKEIEDGIITLLGRVDAEDYFTRTDQTPYEEHETAMSLFIGIPVPTGHFTYCLMTSQCAVESELFVQTHYPGRTAQHEISTGQTAALRTSTLSKQYHSKRIGHTNGSKQSAYEKTLHSVLLDVRKNLQDRGGLSGDEEQSPDYGDSMSPTASKPLRDTHGRILSHVQVAREALQYLDLQGRRRGHVLRTVRMLNTHAATLRSGVESGKLSPEAKDRAVIVIVSQIRECRGEFQRLIDAMHFDEYYKIKRDVELLKQALLQGLPEDQTQVLSTAIKAVEAQEIGLKRVNREVSELFSSISESLTSVTS